LQYQTCIVSYIEEHCALAETTYSHIRQHV